MADNLKFVCLKCGYDLRGQVGDPIRCPECGHTWALIELLTPKEPRQWIIPAILTSYLAGVLCWLVPGWIDGQQEAWDGPSWWIWFLTSGIVCFVAGYLAPRWFIVWPFVVSLCQFLHLAILKAGALWPVGLCLFLGAGALWLLGSGLGAACRNVRPATRE